MFAYVTQRIRITMDPKTRSHELVEYQRIMRPNRASNMDTLLETIENWEDLCNKCKNCGPARPIAPAMICA